MVICFLCHKNFATCKCQYAPAKEPVWVSQFRANRKTQLRGPMRFIYGDDVYALEFQRKKIIINAWDKDGFFQEKLSKFPHTIVNVLRLDPKQAGTKGAEIVYSETVGCYHKDQFSIEGGHLAVLKKLTDKKREKVVPFNLRGLIWKAYMQRGRVEVELPTAAVDAEEMPVEIVDKPYQAQMIQRILDASFEVEVPANIG